LDRAPGDFGVQLCGGIVRRVPGRVLKDPGNVGLALDGQLVLRWRFFSRFFWPAGAALASGEIFRGVRWLYERGAGECTAGLVFPRSSPGLSGRPSIPETAVLEPIGRGVLDRPPSRAMTTEGVRAPRYTHASASSRRHHARVVRRSCPS